MKKASIVLGLCGGAAGIAVHIVLLVRLFGQAGQPLGGIVRLSVGIVLGVAGIAAAVAARGSLRARALFLPSIGLLGLFPNHLPWAPAAALMVTGGVVAFAALLRSAAQPPAATASAAGRAGTTASATGGRGAAASPRPTHDGTPVHWSVAPWVPGTVPSPAPLAERTPVPAAAQASGPAAAQDADPAPARREASWSRSCRGMAPATVVLLAAVVVSLPVWSPGAAADSSPTVPLAGTPASVPSAPPTRIVPETTTSVEPELTSTTTAVASPLDSAAADPDGLVWYSDLNCGFTMAVPASWTEVAWSELADHESSPYHVVGFADTAGPAIAGAYLNGIDVDLVVDLGVDESSLPTLAQGLQQSLDAAAAEYEYFQVLEPVHQVTVGDVPGLSSTARVTWQGRVMVKAVYTCITDHRVYSLGFQTDDADWATYQDLFADIVRSFAFGSAATTV